MSDGYTHLDTTTCSEGDHIFVSVRDKGTNETKKISGRLGEKVSPETYEVILDKLFIDYPAFNLDLGEPLDKRGNYAVFHFHKEDIYSEE